MTKFPAISAAAIALCLFAAPASAQATRTWVSAVGSDINPCSRTAPCQTFAGAISKTFINGEINCIDPGAFGTVTIGKSITIDCHENFAGVLAGGVNGIIINVPVNANDPLRTVRLRNLNINGTGAVGTVGTRTGINGIRILAALVVYVEDMMISSFTTRGISDERTVAGKLYVRNSTLRDNGQSALVVLPEGGVTPAMELIVEGSQFLGNVAAGIAISNGARATVKRSVVSGNGGAGIDAEGTPATTLAIDDSQVTHNNVGFFQSGFGSHSGLEHRVRIQQRRRYRHVDLLHQQPVQRQRGGRDGHADRRCQRSDRTAVSPARHEILSRLRAGTGRLP